MIFKKWRERRRQVAIQDAEERGWNWAAGLMLHNPNQPNIVFDYIGDFGTENNDLARAFDKGAIKAAQTMLKRFPKAGGRREIFVFGSNLAGRHGGR